MSLVMLFANPFTGRPKWCMTLVLTDVLKPGDNLNQLKPNLASVVRPVVWIPPLSPLPSPPKSCNSNYSCNLLTGQGLPRTGFSWKMEQRKIRTLPPTPPLSSPPPLFLSPSSSASTSTHSPRKADAFYDCSETRGVSEGSSLSRRSL